MSIYIEQCRATVIGLI